MAKRITIPASIDEAREQLEGMAALLTAKEWERAAYVWAFTYEGRGGPRTVAEVPRFTVRQFCELKIAGLSSHHTVKLYRDNWKTAIDADQAEDIGPGERAVLPEMDWPTTRTGTNGYDSEQGAVQTIEKIVTKHQDSEAVIALLAAQAARPEVVDAALEQPETRKEIRKGLSRVRSKAKDDHRGKTRTKGKGKVDIDEHEREISELERASMIAEFMVATFHTKSAADDALKVFRQMREVLTGEQINDLVTAANEVIGAWESVRDFIASGGATDKALQDLIDKETGG